jgi:hypothetical protein
MDLARLLGKGRADVFRIAEDMLDHLRHHLAADVGDLLGGGPRGIRTGGPLLAGGLDVRRMRQPRNVGVAAQRARQQPFSELALVVLARVEPALEAMVVAAT